MQFAFRLFEYYNIINFTAQGNMFKVVSVQNAVSPSVFSNLQHWEETRVTLLEGITKESAKMCKSWTLFTCQSFHNVFFFFAVSSVTCNCGYCRQM
jgi:hypothetical protein